MQRGDFDDHPAVNRKLIQVERNDLPRRSKRILLQYYEEFVINLSTK